MDQRKRKTILSVTEESPGTDEPDENYAPSWGVGKEDRDCSYLTLSGLQTNSGQAQTSPRRAAGGAVALWAGSLMSPPQTVSSLRAGTVPYSLLNP